MSLTLIYIYLHHTFEVPIVEDTSLGPLGMWLSGGNLPVSIPYCLLCPSGTTRSLSTSGWQ